MTVKSASRRVALACGGLLGLLLAGCDSAPDTLSANPAAFARGGAALDRVSNKGLAAVRRATARFRSFEAAQAAGYTVLFDPDGEGPGSACLSDPAQGGMGYHYVNPALVGDDEVDEAAPEALIYEPTQNGKLRLVGVEYVVFFTAHAADAPPPELFGGEQFLPNDDAGFHLWGLHAWVWKDNPSGIFAPWNPKVSCQFATQ